jgi:hypothetical protein
MSKEFKRTETGPERIRFSLKSCGVRGSRWNSLDALERAFQNQMND